MRLIEAKYFPPIFLVQKFSYRFPPQGWTSDAQLDQRASSYSFSCVSLIASLLSRGPLQNKGVIKVRDDGGRVTECWELVSL
jgi:hypothetical protein